jgi:peptidoglycan-associated lipoprotein
MLKNLKTKKLLAVALLSMGLLASGCTKDEALLEDPISSSQSKKDGFTVAADGSVKFNAEIVYFKYDDSHLTKQGQDRLASLAKYIKNRKGLKLKVMGHCDERGSEQYNLALGQMRAHSVKEHLAYLGVKSKAIDTISYGEDKPASEGHAESNWKQNRRAEFTFVSMNAE